MTDSGRNTTHKRLVHSWRIAWAAGIFVLVEIIVCGLSALPAVILWSWLGTVLASSSRLLQVILLSVALVPSYIIFALALLFISPVAMRLMGWRTPANAEMRIADLDRPLLSFVRFAAANHFVRVLAGTFFPRFTSLDSPSTAGRRAPGQQGLYQQP
jgi:hypothetical protein